MAEISHHSLVTFMYELIYMHYNKISEENLSWRTLGLFKLSGRWKRYFHDRCTKVGASNVMGLMSALVAFLNLENVPLR